MAVSSMLIANPDKWVAKGIIALVVLSFVLIVRNSSRNYIFMFHVTSINVLFIHFEKKTFLFVIETGDI
jgi:hypothetical protein